MNVVFIIPTGIGCEIGGHAGDASPAAKLIASLCDKFITHPNVFNASDINEMPENTWYVEGSILDGFLNGNYNLIKPYSNKVLVVTNRPIKSELINSVSAARATIGLNAFIVLLDTPLEMIASMSERGAGGEVKGWRELINQVTKFDFDALAIATPITVSREVQLDYFKNGGVNPWGGVEAKASKLIAGELGKPVAHAPVSIIDKEKDPELYFFNKIVDPRIAAEMVSVSYIHCILKGLHKAPRLHYNKKGLNKYEISALITPTDCWGEPHKACYKAGIPIIAVEENTNILDEAMPDEVIKVENYLEAAGVLSAIKAGISLESIKRPLLPTTIIALKE